MLQPLAVIFDIGNVLAGWNPEAFYDRVIGEARRKALFAEVDLYGMNARVDAGASLQGEVNTCALAHPAWAAEIQFWHDRWFETVTAPIEGSVRLQRALRAKGVAVFALTNFGRDTWAIALPKLPFLADFDRHYISGVMGVNKPDPLIYQMVEDDCGIAPDRLLFTDDKAENITAAARRGWRTHQFESWQGWAARLVAEGLLTTKEAGI